MPIHSSYSAASDKVSLPRANAPSRTGSQDSQTSFQSLLSSIAPKTGNTPATGVKTMPEPKTQQRRTEPKTTPKESKEKTDPKVKDQEPKKLEQAEKSEPAESADPSIANADETKTPVTDQDQQPAADAGEAEISDEQPGKTPAAAVNVVLTTPAETASVEKTDAASEKTETTKAKDDVDATAQAQAMAGGVQQAQTASSPVDQAISDAESSSDAAGATVPAGLTKGDQNVAAQSEKTVIDPNNAKASADSRTTQTEKTGENKVAKADKMAQELVETTVDEAAPSDDFAKALDELTAKMKPQASAEPAMQAVSTSQKLAEPEATSAVAKPQLAAPMENNQERIVSAVQSQISTRGGTMRIRLDPPELGAMQVKVEMRGDQVSATFQTASDQAAQILTHGLAQLKSALEKQGLSVDRLQVQTMKTDSDAQMGADSGNSGTGQWQGYQGQQDQQRRETLNRLWKQAAFGRDPLDMVA